MILSLNAVNHQKEIWVLMMVSDVSIISDIWLCWHLDSPYTWQWEISNLYQIWLILCIFWRKIKHPFLPDSKNYISISGEKYNKCRDNCTICCLVMVEQILQFECTLFWYHMPEKHDIERQMQKMHQSCVCKLWVVQ